MNSLPRRLGLLLALYVAQGLPTGVFTQALPAILRSYDAPLSVISLSGLLALPWALKVLWAPWVDRHYWPRMGYRRSWIVPMNIGLIVLLAMLSQLDPNGLRHESGVLVLFFLLFLINLFAATQDIATDGLAVGILGPHERGIGNGVQVAGYRLGLIIGGGLLLYVLGTWGWQNAFLGLTGLSVLLLLPALFFRESGSLRPPALSHQQREAYAKGWLSFFQRPALAGWIWVLVTYKIAESLGSAMVKPMMIDNGFTLAEMGLQISIVGSVASIVGALLGGWLTDPLGRRRALVLFGLLQTLAVSLYALPAAGWVPPGMDWRSWVITVNAIEHVVSGMAMAAMLAAIMDRARDDHAGSDFTLQVSLLAVFGGAFYIPAGLLAESVGYATHFVIAGLAGLLLIWPAWRYTREPEELLRDARLTALPLNQESS